MKAFLIATREKLIDVIVHPMFSTFINAFAIALASMEIISYACGASLTLPSMIIAWACVILWIINTWIVEHQRDKVQRRVNDLEAEIASLKDA